jgi:PhnB protein
MNSGQHNFQRTQTQIKKMNTISLAPWLSVADGSAALVFYKAAFGAAEKLKFEPGEGALIARLSVGAAEFWISGDPTTDVSQAKREITSIRLLLSVDDPDTFFAQAVQAGARIISPVSESHGWRVGRIEDPFGFHWEIGKET